MLGSMMNKANEVTFPCRTCGVRLPKRESIEHISTHPNPNIPRWAREMDIKLDQLINLMEFQMTDEESLRFHQIYEVEIG